MKVVFAARGLPVTPGTAWCCVTSGSANRDAVVTDRARARLPAVRQAGEPRARASASRRRRPARARRGHRPRLRVRPQGRRRSRPCRRPAKSSARVLGNDDPEASVAGEIVPVARVLRLRGQVPGRRVEAASFPRRSTPSSRTPSPAAGDRGVPRHRLRRHGARRLPAVAARPGSIFVNEVNTIPGFTTISMFAKLWAATGVDYPALLDRLDRAGPRAPRREAAAHARA